MDRITDRPDMTSAVYRGCKASTQTKTKPLETDLSYGPFPALDGSKVGQVYDVARERKISF